VDLGGSLNCKSSLEHPIFCGFGWFFELQIFIKNPIFCNKLATKKLKIIKHDFVTFMGLF
jgi:hypothetical protein